MRKAIEILILLLIVTACNDDSNKYPIKQANWESKQITMDSNEKYFHGKTYLPVYSHIYHHHEHKTFDLTTTVSIRNVSERDSVFLLKANYYNTIGENIRQYIKKPIYLKPLETLEIIIEEQDNEGGSGANFIFDWAMNNDKNPPLFEAVMISTSGQQGLSYTTRGVQVFE
ncbi:DUF3124 domain-containing protein [Marinifilum fragile]|uniref:DUF3124 domain-containing protein n=1 Tax=Marinifilum fragile TaxID=570161 RepID=UPI0006D0DA45|nr:DUF3124 domain-containing protein [Marinifilum fragile]